MKKGSVSSHNLGTLQSPGAPIYRDESVGSQKGWSSERLPFPRKSRSTRRHLSAASLMPFNGGRTLPSKWEDAERWICSPISGNGIGKNLNSQRPNRPKSKSGPIVPPEVAYYSHYSPAMQGLEGGSATNFLAGSPLSAGVLAADGLFVRFGSGDGGKSYLVPAENNLVVQSASLPGWSEMLSELSLPSSQDEKVDGTEETMECHAVLRRDMATQMSPEGSINSSPRGKSSFSPTPPSFPSIMETQGDNSPKLEVRDVQVDKRATVIRWSKRQKTYVTKKGLPHVEDFNKHAKEAQASSWDIAEAEMNISKLQREEAKITAWENLQKAKAEAAIRKLEMRLEKKKSSSMDKILNKLRMAERKAHTMRSEALVHQGHQVPKASRKVVSFRKYVWLGSFSSCFTTDAF
ncbi:hypothetical protein FH972_004026 [Carpinus fangiana]|uniref:Remorin C-terminal domain-containing protein n=1 Tax=Carpinus fangiana TaxID=176857 RepID=A0A5N6QJU8_9ROSI|nr:hypothetical protein FH972_004026 [Carpinus fangiana]